MELFFEVGDGRGENEGDHIDKVVEGKCDNGCIVILSLLVLGDIGNNVCEAKVGEISEHEVNS